MPVEFYTNSTTASSAGTYYISYSNNYVDKYGNNYPVYMNNGNYPYLQDPPEPEEERALWEQI